MIFIRSMLAVMALATVTPAVAADPIWDPTEIARMGEQAAQLSLSLTATMDMLRNLDHLAAAIGRAGPSSATTSVNGAILSGLTSLAPPPTAAQGAVGSIRPGIKLSATQREQQRALLIQARQDSARLGFALAQATNKALGTAGDRAQALTGLAGAAQDARSDMQANSAVGLAVLVELTSIDSLLSALLAGRTARSLQQYTDLGGI